MKVWAVYTCKRYPNDEISHPCVVAVLTDKEKAKSVARKNGAWMTEVEVARFRHFRVPNKFARPESPKTRAEITQLPIRPQSVSQ